jgi:hypothetical protein
MPGPTITATESVWNTATTPKSVVVVGCLTGDRLYAFAGGDDANSVTAATTTTTVGSTGAWTEPQEGVDGLACWYHTATAIVTADGDVTVQIAATGAAQAWGMFVLRARGSSGTGASGVTANSAIEVVNLTVEQDSVVGFASFDFDAGAVGTGWTPSGTETLVERSTPAGYTVHAAYWLGQAAGTRDYGSTGAAGSQLRCVAIEIKAAVVAAGKTPHFVSQYSSYH